MLSSPEIANFWKMWANKAKLLCFLNSRRGAAEKHKLKTFKATFKATLY